MSRHWQANRQRQRANAAVKGSPLGFPAASAAAQTVLNRLSPCGLALLHLHAALGYDWGVQVDPSTPVPQAETPSLCSRC